MMTPVHGMTLKTVMRRNWQRYMRAAIQDELIEPYISLTTKIKAVGSASKRRGTDTGAALTSRYIEAKNAGFTRYTASKAAILTEQIRQLKINDARAASEKVVSKTVSSASVSVRQIGTRARLVRTAFSNLKVTINEMPQEQRIDFILKIIMYATAAICGASLGYKVPDVDISVLGIGKHRNILFHSSLTAFASRKACRAVLNTFVRITEDISSHCLLTDEEKARLAVAQKILASAVGGANLGMCLGVTTHLWQDGILEPSGTIRSPWFNTFVSGTTLDDQAWLVANGFVSAVLGLQVNRNEAASAPNPAPTTLVVGPCYSL